MLRGLFFLVACGLCFGCDAAKVVDSVASKGTSPSPANSKVDQVNKSLQGTVRIDGSSTVYPISEAAGSAFHEKFPNVDVTVGVKGTGGGFSEFVKGNIDIADASRPIKQNELSECVKNGIRFI